MAAVSSWRVDEQVVAAMASRTPSNSVSGEAKDGTGT